LAEELHLDYRLLGPLEVWAGNVQRTASQAKQRAVLALLLLDLNRPVSTDRLIELLWPDKPPGRPQTAIQGYVSGLRKLLGQDTIETTAAGYVLHAEAEQLDVNRFERLLREGREALAAGHSEQAARGLSAGLELWRGPALADFTYERWSQSEIGRLEELRLVAREELLEGRLALGQHAEVVGELEAMIREQPLRERPRGQLMLALYRSGRQAEALEWYQDVRERLVEELGIDPSLELRALYRKILNQDASLIVDAPSLQAPTNLRAPSTALLGRMRELADVHALLCREDVRLVTLTGTGGTGKTRLSLEAAAALLGDFVDGVFVVPLDVTREPGLVVAQIAQVLEVREQPAQMPGEAVAAHLREKQILLILDNFEHVLEAAPSVADLMAACPHLKVLVTSRTPLHVRGEHEYPVPPLIEADAATLFRERALAKRPDFSGDRDVAEICRRLDCLPLAIELAAARVKTLSGPTILEKLDDRLSLLTRGARDLPRRQQTLRATVEWSYELLGEEERQAFAAVAIFAGGFTAKAAEAVAGADVDLVDDLVDHSLVHVVVERYAMLETIREYAAECLEQSDDREVVRERHARFYLELTEEARHRLDGPEQALWLREIDRESPNIQVALSWALERGDGDIALRLAVGIARVWRVHGQYAKARSWLEQALRHPAPAAERAKGYVTLASTVLDHGDFEEGARVATTAIELCRDEVGDQALLGKALNNLGVARLYLGDQEEAAKMFGESLELARATGDLLSIVPAVHNLGEIALAQDRPADAVASFTEALAVARNLEHAYLCARCLSSLGAALIDTGDADAAACTLVETLELAIGLEDVETTMDALENTAAVAAERGAPQLGARLLGAAAAARAQIDAPPTPIHGERLSRLELAILSAVGEEVWRNARSEGGELDLKAAKDLALGFLGHLSASAALTP
jgi:predicted ATPase/DNA-binding SARP family transcriptional activator